MKRFSVASMLLAAFARLPLTLHTLPLLMHKRAFIAIYSFVLYLPVDKKTWLRMRTAALLSAIVGDDLAVRDKHSWARDNGENYVPGRQDWRVFEAREQEKRRRRRKAESLAASRLSEAQTKIARISFEFATAKRLPNSEAAHERKKRRVGTAHRWRMQHDRHVISKWGLNNLHFQSAQHNNANWKGPHSRMTLTFISANNPGGGECVRMKSAHSMEMQTVLLCTRSVIEVRRARQSRENWAPEDWLFGSACITEC